MDRHFDVKKKVLAAIIPEAKQLLEILIGKDLASISYVHKFNDAIDLAESTQYDLIVCGIHFDESRALELLQRVKKTKGNQHTPFVVLRTNPKPIGVGLGSSVQLAVRTLGGTDYFDIADSVLSLDEMKIHLGRVFESLLTNQSKVHG